MVPGHLRSECPLGWVEDHGVHFSHLIISAAFLRADGLAPGLGALGRQPKLGEEKGFPSSTAFKAATTSASPDFPCRHGHQSQPGSGNWKLPASPMSIPEFPFHLFIFNTSPPHQCAFLKVKGNVPKRTEGYWVACSIWWLPTLIMIRVASSNYDSEIQQKYWLLWLA